MKPENPQAFASCATSSMGDVYHQEGMTLRDYFAAHAIGKVNVPRGNHPSEYHAIAESAYYVADAMLKERRK